jgi:hypothetical protein
MQRLGLALVPFLLLSGCIFKQKESFYTYCDSTGCYRCDQTGCSPWSPGSGCRSDADCGGQGSWCELSSGQCRSGGNGSSCTNDASCPPGYFCHPTSKQCLQSWKCTVDADCGAGMVCDSRHTCVPGPSSCTPTTGCAKGCYCAGGKCNETGLCKVDADCKMFGPAYTCQAGTCVNVPGTPGTAGGCTYNVDCGANKTCLNGTCHAGCSSNTDCTNVNDICLQGVCQANTGRVAQCKINDDCGAGQECVNAMCKYHCYSNADCSACANGYVCSMGYCG